MYRLLELASQFIALKYDYTFHKINKYWMLFVIPLPAFAYTATGLCLYCYRPLLILLPAFAYTATGLCLYCYRPLLILLPAFAYTAIGLCLYCYRPLLILLSAFPYTADFFPIISQLVIYRSIIENFRVQCPYILNKTNRF
jgi:hypothetical protein